MFTLGSVVVLCLDINVYTWKCRGVVSGYKCLHLEGSWCCVWIEMFTLGSVVVLCLDRNVYTWKCRGVVSG